MDHINPYRIGIHMGHGTDRGRFIQQGLKIAVTFPKITTAIGCGIICWNMAWLGHYMNQLQSAGIADKRRFADTGLW
jgi:hypothetical protein